ncbi:AI-2E family transporter [uncultured Alistipes sp.]|uniref:AI-2E family transporter n=1 Tax=uncultured Alistipes sp. TaxID=538949 RepID=UPI00260DF5ED|nr:AI-2E family transporter [uncultured Alistipes sp.]
MSLKAQYWRYSLIVIVLGLGITVFVEIIPFLGGILGAFTIYILVRKQMRYLTEVRKMKRGPAALLVLVESILCFLAPISLVVWMIVNKLQHINLDPQAIMEPIRHVSALVEQKTGYNLFDSDNLTPLLSYLPKLGQVLMEWIGSFALNLLVLVVVLYFMLIGGPKMEAYFSDILPFSRRNTKDVLHEIKMIVRSNAIGIPLLALIQGFIAWIGYLIFGVPDALLFGVITCVATIIPIVGTAIVWFPLAAYLALNGQWGHAIGLFVYSSVLITQSDNLIRFMLQKKMADIHPLITIFGVVIGLSLFGFMGIIFGPLLLSMFVLCVSIFKREYLDDAPHRRTAKALPVPTATAAADDPVQKRR